MWINNGKNFTTEWKFVKVFDKYIRFNSELSETLKLDEYRYCHIEELGDDRYGDFAFHFCKERRTESTPYSSKSEPYTCAIRIACKYAALSLSNKLGNKCIVPIEYTKNDNEVVITTMWRMNNGIL